MPFAFRHLSCLKQTIFLLWLGIAFSCVGTVDDANPDLTKAATGSEVVSYAGIRDAKGISMDRIEVFFPKASAETLNTVYEINFDDLTNKISVPATVLQSVVLNGDPVYIYTMTGLDSGRTYTISVEIKQSANQVSKTGTSVTATTFSHETADFNGISDVRNVPGDLASTSLRVTWIPATKFGFLSKHPRDPKSYQVEAVPSSEGPAGFDNPAVLISTTVDSSKQSVDLIGLNPATEYLVRVRSIHEDWVSGDPSKPFEQNSRYLSLATGGTCPIVKPETFTSLLGNFSLGKRFVNIQWESPTGDFERYDLTYTVNGTPIATPIQLDKNFTNYEIGPFAENDAITAITLTTVPDPGSGCGTPPTYNTLAETVEFAFAGFPGIKQISLPAGASTFDRIAVELFPLDFSNGGADGVDVTICGNSTGATCTGGAAADLESFDINTESTIFIQNLNLSDSFICVSVALTLGASTSTPKTSCISKNDLVSATLPNFSNDQINCEYSRGFNAGVAISPGGADFNWVAPDSGSFDFYVLFFTDRNFDTPTYDTDVQFTISEAVDLFNSNNKQIEGLDGSGNPKFYDFNWVLVNSASVGFNHQLPVTWGLCIICAPPFVYKNPHYMLVPGRIFGSQLFPAKGVTSSMQCAKGPDEP